MTNKSAFEKAMQAMASLGVKQRGSHKDGVSVFELIRDFKNEVYKGLAVEVAAGRYFYGMKPDETPRQYQSRMLKQLGE